MRFEIAAKSWLNSRRKLYSCAQFNSCAYSISLYNTLLNDTWNTIQGFVK